MSRPDPTLLPVRDETFADLVALYKGDEDLALSAFIRAEARRQANAKIDRNTVIDDQLGSVSVYLDLGPISDLALKCQRMDYSYALIRSPAFREACEVAALGAARPFGSYVPQVAA